MKMSHAYQNRNVTFRVSFLVVGFDQLKGEICHGSDANEQRRTTTESYI